MLRPLPPHLDQLKIGYEVDPMLYHLHELSLTQPPEDVEQFYWNQGYPYILKFKPVVGYNDCWLLCKANGKLVPNAKLLRKMKWILSDHIGTELAAFYEFLPTYYDKDFRDTYKHSITVQCKFGQKHCIRPSHLIPCTYLGHPLRPSDGRHLPGH